MSISKFRTPSGGRKVATAAGLLSVLGTLGLGVVSPASATSVTEPAPVSLAIQNGDFVASLCGMDNLEGRCTYDVAKREIETFTVRPRAGEPVQARVVVSRGGSDYVFTVPEGNQVCFEVGGDRQNPTLTVLPCG